MRLLISLILVLAFSVSYAQTIEGVLKQLQNQRLKLEGFNGLETYFIDETTIHADGSFKLSYSNDDYGVGYLKSADDNPVFVILSGEDIRIEGEALSLTETLNFTEGEENIFFEQYAREHPKREQALSAWIYLEKMYNQDSLFAVQKEPQNAIMEEKKRLKSEDEDFIKSLPKDSYVRWFLPTRRIVSSVSTVAQHRPEEIPKTIHFFRDLDYTDERLYKSGLFRDAIESHFWLLENSGKPLDSVYQEMKVSIDAMFEKLIFDEEKLNEVTDYLFDLLERHSLFKASEYLALKVLNEVSCTIDSDLEKQLETYRAMKKGNTAPDIKFEFEVLSQNYDSEVLPKKMSELKSDYTVVVFAASWCPKCTEEVPQIADVYSKWKDNNVEVVLVSLDDNKADFENFVKDFPFISTSSFKKWDCPIVNDFYVFGTPTMYLLDDKREIILRPNSFKQMDAWVDWFLIEGNPMPE